MRSLLSTALFGLLTAGLSGCAAWPGLTPGITARGTLAVTPGAPYTVAAWRPYAKAHLSEVRVYLRAGTGAETLAQTVLPAQFDTPLVLTGLQADTAYRIRLEAYQVEDGAPVAVHEAGDGSETAFSTGGATLVDLDDPAIGGVKLRLLSRPFSGGVTGGIQVAPELADPTEPESARQIAPEV